MGVVQFVEGNVNLYITKFVFYILHIAKCAIVRVRLIDPIPE